MQAPVYNEANVNINNRYQVHKSFLYSNVCDINALYLITVIDFNAEMNTLWAALTINPPNAIVVLSERATRTIIIQTIKQPV